MEISCLASGSSGNCFYIEDKGSAILIDAGIPTKQIITRLSMINRGPDKIKAIFITHEHSDHTKGADVFSRKFNIPIFATKKTFENSRLCSNEHINEINNNESIKIKTMEVQAFSKSHKASDPVSFSILSKKKISIMTDIGYCCNNVIDNISDSDLLCIESNYDEEMLDNGSYPYFLKKWIKSDIGHLSNKDASLSVLEHAKPRLKYLILSHLSINNNTPELALNTFNVLKQRKDLKPKIFLSGRNFPTEIFKI